MRKVRFGIFIILSLLAIVSVVSASQVTATISYTGASPYWNVHIDTGTGILTSGNNYIGWCADSNAVLGNGQHTFNVYSSLGNDHVPSITSAEWGSINWVLNNKPADWKVVQMLVWHYDGQSDPSIAYPWHWSLGSAPTQEQKDQYDVLKALADQHTDFIPDCGDKYAAIILNVNPQTGLEDGQAIFIEAIRTTCPGPDPGIPVPEFPTLALPVGMMIGLVGLVYIIKNRE